jgi:membrane fusion protein, heavy metal efflux system
MPRGGTLAASVGPNLNRPPWGSSAMNATLTGVRAHLPVIAVLVLSAGAMTISFGTSADSTEAGLLAVRPQVDPSGALKPSPDADVVRLPESSRQYITTESAAAKASGATIEVPARVAFRDGAVADVSVPVAGRVMRTHVKVGDTVRKGDPLLTIVSPSAAASRSELARARLELRTAEDLATRNERLMQQGVGVEVELLAAKKALSEAQVELQRAERTATFIGEGDDEMVIVRAPVGGVVTERKATVGAIVDLSNGALVQIGDPHSLWVVAEVFERDLPLVKVGAEVALQLATVPKPVTGSVVAIGGAVRPESRRAPVYIELAQSDLPLRAGMYARASIQGVSATWITLPTEAVLLKDDGTHRVFIERTAGEYVPRDVGVGVSAAGKVQVVRGVEPGERVVVSGSLLLDGAAEKLL